jgi:hypothetical protein
LIHALAHGDNRTRVDSKLGAVYFRFYQFPQRGLLIVHFRDDGHKIIVVKIHSRLERGVFVADKFAHRICVWFRCRDVDKLGYVKRKAEFFEQFPKSISRDNNGAAWPVCRSCVPNSAPDALSRSSGYNRLPQYTQGQSCQSCQTTSDRFCPAQA